MDSITAIHKKDLKKMKTRPHTLYHIKFKAVSRQLKQGYIKASLKVGKPSRATTMKLYRMHFEPRVHLTDIATVFTNVNKMLKHQAGTFSEMGCNSCPPLLLEPRLAQKDGNATRDCLDVPNEDFNQSVGVFKKHRNKNFDSEKADRSYDPYKFEDTERSAQDYKTFKNKAVATNRKPMESRQVESFVKNASIVLKIRTSQDIPVNDDKSPSPMDNSYKHFSNATSTVKTQLESIFNNDTNPTVELPKVQKDAAAESLKLSDCNTEFDSVIEGVSEENFIEDEDETTLIINEDVTDASALVDSGKAFQNSMVKDTDFRKIDETVVRHKSENFAQHDFSPKIISVTSLSEANRSDVKNISSVTPKHTKVMGERRKRKQKESFTTEQHLENTWAKNFHLKKRKGSEEHTEVNIFHEMKEEKRHAKEGQFVNVKVLESDKTNGNQEKKIDNGTYNCNISSDKTLLSHTYNPSTVVMGQRASNLQKGVSQLNHNLHCLSSERRSLESKQRKLKMSAKTGTVLSLMQENDASDPLTRENDHLQILTVSQPTVVKGENRVNSPEIAPPERLIRDFVNHNWLVQKYQIGEAIAKPKSTVAEKPTQHTCLTSNSVGKKDHTTSAAESLSHILIPVQQLEPSSQIAALKMHQNSRDTKHLPANINNHPQVMVEEKSKAPIKDFQTNTVNPILPKLSSKIVCTSTVHYIGTNVLSVDNTVKNCSPSSDSTLKSPPQLNVQSIATGSNTAQKVGNASMLDNLLPRATARKDSPERQSQEDLMDLSMKKFGEQNDVSDVPKVQGVHSQNENQQGPSVTSSDSERDNVLMELKKQFQHFQKMYKKLEKLEEIKEKETIELKSKVQEAASQMEQIHANINRLVEGSKINTNLSESYTRREEAPTSDGDVTLTEPLEDKVKSKQPNVKGESTRDTEVSIYYPLEKESSVCDTKYCINADKLTECKTNEAHSTTSVKSPNDDSICFDEKECKPVKTDVACKDEIGVEHKESAKSSMTGILITSNTKNILDLQHNEALLKDKITSGIVKSIVEEVITSSVDIGQSNISSVCNKHDSTNPVETHNNSCQVEKEVQNTLRNIIGPNRQLGRVRSKCRLQRGMGQRFRAPPNVTCSNRAAIPFFQDLNRIEPRNITPPFIQLQPVNPSCHMPVFQQPLPMHPRTASHELRQMHATDQSVNSVVRQQIQPMQRPRFEPPPTISQHIVDSQMGNFQQPSGNGVYRPENVNCLVAARPARLERPGLMIQAVSPVMNQSVQKPPPFNSQVQFKQKNQGWLNHAQRLPFQVNGGNNFTLSQHNNFAPQNMEILRYNRNQPMQEIQQQTQLYQTVQNGTHLSQSVVETQNKAVQHNPINHDNYLTQKNKEVPNQEIPTNVNSGLTTEVSNKINQVAKQDAQKCYNGHDIVEDKPELLNQRNKIEISKDKTRTGKKVKSPTSQERKIAANSAAEETFAGNTTGRNGNKGLKKNPQCSVCNKQAIFICSGCKKVPYCSQKCQNEAWCIHSKDCK